MFDRRQTWADIVYTRDVNSDVTVVNTVEDGDEVTLVHDDVGIHVIVMDIQSLPDNRYHGRIKCFEPINSHDYRELHQNLLIEFAESNIFFCRKT